MFIQNWVNKINPAAEYLESTDDDMDEPYDSPYNPHFNHEDLITVHPSNIPWGDENVPPNQQQTVSSI